MTLLTNGEAQGKFALDFICPNTQLLWLMYQPPHNLPLWQCLKGISENPTTHINKIPRDYQALLFLVIFKIAK